MNRDVVLGGLLFLFVLAFLWSCAATVPRPSVPSIMAQVVHDPASAQIANNDFMKAMKESGCKSGYTELVRAPDDDEAWLIAICLKAK